MTPRQIYIGLNMIPQLGPVRIRALLDAFDSAQGVMEAAPEALVRVKGIGPQLASMIDRGRQQIDPRREEEDAEALGFHIITQLDEAYPEVLRTIYDPPLVLYVWGQLEPKDRHAVAVVGSRRCSQYGLRTADRLSYMLGQSGYTVISGLARGIDTAAHTGALKSGGRTIAVLGGALNRLYPAENSALAEQIAKQGAVLSEFPLGREPDRTTFPYRNRVVSGMSRGVLVVESPLKSGSLITANQAMEQGRQVFAVPGRIDTPGAQGCNRLIQNGAKLVTCIDDVLDEFEQLLTVEQKTTQQQAALRPDLQLSTDEVTVVTALADDVLDVDTLAQRCSLSPGQLGGLMLGLEMKRVVRMLPGRRVELVVSADQFRA